MYDIHNWQQLVLRELCGFILSRGWATMLTRSLGTDESASPNKQQDFPILFDGFIEV